MVHNSLFHIESLTTCPAILTLIGHCYSFLGRNFYRWAHTVLYHNDKSAKLLTSPACVETHASLRLLKPLIRTFKSIVCLRSLRTSGSSHSLWVCSHYRTCFPFVASRQLGCLDIATRRLFAKLDLSFRTFVYLASLHFFRGPQNQLSCGGSWQLLYYRLLFRHRFLRRANFRGRIS